MYLAEHVQRVLPLELQRVLEAAGGEGGVVGGGAVGAEAVLGELDDLAGQVQRVAKG